MEKKVDTKRARRTLVATDDSWCTVAGQQLAQTKIGDLMNRAWT